MLERKASGQHLRFGNLSNVRRVTVWVHILGLTGPKPTSESTCSHLFPANEAK